MRLTAHASAVLPHMLQRYRNNGATTVLTSTVKDLKTTAYDGLANYEIIQKLQLQISMQYEVLISIYYTFLLNFFMFTDLLCGHAVA
jgi:hypothetical protein